MVAHSWKVRPVVGSIGAIPIGVIFVAMLSVRATWAFKSFVKTKKAMSWGYTTIWRAAEVHPELTYL